MKRRAACFSTDLQLMTSSTHFFGSGPNLGGYAHSTVINGSASLEFRPDGTFNEATASQTSVNSDGPHHTVGSLGGRGTKGSAPTRSAAGRC